ncbi:bifunctional 3-(3-hydroxy-phenyl)propionate/3-hydroxycinnamic acid hydroxylase [Sciscionella marina]|uniref:bifunctional 3-(3-hydroxy-phenyl)propionate/3-hydroxycinnamic acid hydroxylase MhpA n=1 Tax=Sciscionella marina TaxID=508770 RepID=UPI0003763A40|nr:bifunctional 3-(3-hydroxy-phenyl)propionate/3-hydroxycinnamic acid hydroxylase [Sciscionella marina]
MIDESYDADVAIVGYGPTGLVAASILGGMGHRVVVVERHSHLYGLPRLTHIDGEAARIVQAAADVDVALRDAHALDSFKYINTDGKLLVELPWDGESCGHPAHISMYQPDIEDAIDTRVRQHPNVLHLCGWQATDLHVLADRVELTAHEAHGDRRATVRSRYLLGADGANSFVRTALGIGQFDFGVDERWLNIDTKTLRRLPARFDHTMLFCDPARPHMFMPIGHERQRFEFAALPGENEDVLEVRDRAWQWLWETHGLGPDDVEIIRQVLYPIRARIADSWSVGNRVFLVGDAAHTMPPTMGQGACSGMRDAVTLAWKLDLVLRERAAEQLLATYEGERRPHALTIIETSIMLGDVAYTMDPARAAARDEAFLSGSMPPPPPFPVLETGVVHTAGDGTPAPFAGTLAPQGPVSTPDGRSGRFDDVFGHGFRLVTRTGTDGLLDREQEAFLDEIGCTVHTLAEGEARSFRDVAGTYTRYLDDVGADMFLSRPDFAIFGTCAAAGIGPLIAQLREKLNYVSRPEPDGARMTATR